MKGKIKVTHAGFEYLKQHDFQNGDRSWRCVHYAKKCKGKAFTREINSRHLLKIINEHNHPPKITSINSEEEFSLQNVETNSI